MSELTIAASVVSALIEFGVSKGVCRKALAERSGILAGELQDPDHRVPFTRYVALMKAGQELCNDPALALHFGESVDMSEISAACLIGAPSGTWADGFAQLNRYARLAVEVDTAGGGDRFRLTRCGEQLWVTDTRKDLSDFPEFAESTFARMVCSTRRFLGEKEFVKAVHFIHAAPAYRAEYDRIFQVPVVFGSDKNALLTDAAWLTYTTPILPRYVSEVLRAHAEGLLEKLEGTKSVRGRVETFLLPILHTGETSMGLIASKLGLSRQTLFRKLKAEGTTFSKVLDELRHKLALHYLSGRDASVNEVAYLVGFSEPAAFSRAFRRWTGSSPRRVLASRAERQRGSPLTR